VKQRVAGIFLVMVVVVGGSSWAAEPAEPADATVAVAEPGKLAEVAAALQKTMQATDEEWSVILPKLQEIEALRDELQATAAPAPKRMGGQFDSPLGGTSMDAPTMSGRRGVSNPFDPKSAPGIKDNNGGILGVLGLRRTLNRAVAGIFKPNNGNRVEHLLNDLNQLLAAKETTDEQLREKLASIRAARAKVSRELSAAQEELEGLLTVDQLGHLVTMGYMD